MKIQPLEAPASKNRDTNHAESRRTTEHMHFDLLLSAGIFQTQLPRSTCSHEFERQRQNSLRNVSTNLGARQRTCFRGERKPTKDFPKAGED